MFWRNYTLLMLLSMSSMLLHKANSLVVKLAIMFPAVEETDLVNGQYSVIWDIALHFKCAPSRALQKWSKIQRILNFYDELLTGLGVCVKIHSDRQTIFAFHLIMC